jgi:hypothetical protein
MVLMVDETAGRESHNLLVYSDGGLSAVFIAVTLGVKRIAFRDCTPFIFIQPLEIFDVHSCKLAARKPNASERIAIPPTAISKRKGNEPISQRRTDYKIKFDRNYNFDRNTRKVKIANL